jgi:hypothetical protein
MKYRTINFLFSVGIVAAVMCGDAFAGQPSAIITKLNGERVVGAIKGLVVFRGEVGSEQTSSGKTFTTEYVILEGRGIAALDSTTVRLNSVTCAWLVIAAGLGASVPDSNVYPRIDEIRDQGAFGLREAGRNQVIGHMRLIPKDPNMPSRGYSLAVMAETMADVAPKDLTEYVINRCYDTAASITIREVPFAAGNSDLDFAAAYELSLPGFSLIGELRDNKIVPALEVITGGIEDEAVTKTKGMIVKVSELRAGRSPSAQPRN